MHPERDGTVTLEAALHTHINISFIVSLLSQELPLLEERPVLPAFPCALQCQLVPRFTLDYEAVTNHMAFCEDGHL